MDTYIQCDCGEQAVGNDGHQHSDYRCSHCDSFYAIKNTRIVSRDQATPVDEQFRRNREQYGVN